MHRKQSPNRVSVTPLYLHSEYSEGSTILNSSLVHPAFVRLGSLSPFSISSTPALTTPTKPPVCTTSPPPPLSLHSISASPSNHATLVCAGTSSLLSSSPSAVRMSARARPWEVFRELMVERQEVISGLERRVVRMVWTAAGGGAAMQVYIVESVIGSVDGAGFGLVFVGKGVSGGNNLLASTLHHREAWRSGERWSGVQG